jgi:serine/threonine protein phosphatase PrpC
MKKLLGSHDFSKEYPPSSRVFDALKEAFLTAQQEVVNMPMDTRYSGSTCVSVMTIGKKLFVANVGDSRGIVIKSLTDQQINDVKNSKEDLT